MGFLTGQSSVRTTVKGIPRETGRERRRRGPWLLLAMVLLALDVWPQPTEYQLKAVFLFNFSQFVDWPPAAFADERAPLVIGVLGEDPFGGELDAAVSGETVNGRPLTVRRYRRVEEIEQCHILFIDRSERDRLGKILDKIDGRSVLTVGDFEGFARNGGMIRFVSSGNRIRLRINLEAAQAADLAISSKLLRPAEIVRKGDD